MTLILILFLVIIIILLFVIVSLEKKSNIHYSKVKCRKCNHIFEPLFTPMTIFWLSFFQNIFIFYTIFTESLFRFTFDVQIAKDFPGVI